MVGTNKMSKDTFNNFDALKECATNGLDDASRCTGCQLCVKVCPQNAISMVKDGLGFLVAHIDSDKCIDCSECRRVCEAMPTYRQEANASREYYAVINKDKSVVRKSGSGGIFTALAEIVISMGGSVFGAAYGENFYLEHIAVDSLDDLHLVRGAKYIQSDISKAYEKIKELLIANRPVLFVGMSCQCAAVREYLAFEKVDTEQLFLVDFFCNGSVSPAFWKSYVEYLEERFGKLNSVVFRDKSKGWRNKSMKVFAEQGDISKFCNHKASVVRFYEQKIAFREVCYRCDYMNLDRVGDLSIGDFWGIERVKPSLDNNTGVSALIINNSKGEKLFALAKKELKVEQFTGKAMLQPVLMGGAGKPVERDAFLECYQNESFDTVIEKYAQVRGFSKIKRDFIVPILYKFRLAGLASVILHAKDRKD